MSIKLQLPALTELKPRIVVVGVGGAGGNAINNMIASGLTGVEFVAANTDAQALSQSAAEHRIQLGVNLTEGLGAGARPEIGEAAAEEAVDDLRQQLSGAHMCFIAAGMGGGTGSGAAAVIARVAKEIGLLTVGVVTKPFQFEGGRRMRIAETGVEALRRHVDTLIVIPNQNLFRVANERTTFADAFKLADQILHSGVACIVDLIVRDGLINLDFADVRTVMSEMGTAMMGTGEAGGERRAIEAAEAAIHNPILDEVSLRGAKGLLLSITGGRDLTLYEVDEAASRIREEVDPDANIIVGATFDDSLENKIRVSIVATGVEIAASARRSAPVREPSSAPASKAAGSEANEQVKRQLSDAMRQDQRRLQSGTGDEPLDLQGSQRLPDPSGWQGPGSVMITEGMPRLSHGPDQAAGRDGAGQRPPGTDNARYQPERPHDPRVTGRRVPEIQDFPPIGQQAYSGSQANTPTSATDAGRKPGFFGRWTAGLQRLAGESVSGDSRGQGVNREAENPRPEAEPGRPSVASDVHAKDARRPIEQPVGESGSRPQADGQPTEIPKFFQRKSG